MKGPVDAGQIIRQRPGPTCTPSTTSTDYGASCRGRDRQSGQRDLASSRGTRRCASCRLPKEQLGSVLGGAADTDGSLLERLWPTSLLLNLDEDVLLEILTYHQVPAHILTFLASGGESWSFASSMSFAGFRGRSTLPPQRRQPGLAGLGRSGAHVQVCLTLFSMREYPQHALPRDADAARAPRWETHSAVAYLHFDLVEGAAVWLLASPRCYHPDIGEGTQNQLWNTLKESLAGDLDALASLDAPERFRISVNCLLAVAEWSVGKFSRHLQDTERRLSDLVSPRSPELH